MSGCRYRLFSIVNAKDTKVDLEEFSEAACSLYEDLLEHDFYQPVKLDAEHLGLQYISNYQLGNPETITSRYLIKIDKRGNCEQVVRVGVDDAVSFSLNEFQLTQFDAIDPKVKEFQKNILEPLLLPKKNFIQVHGSGIH